MSDQENHRVVKRIRGATEGIVVAGGQGLGKALTQFSRPEGLLVDASGTVYVADGLNHRIMRWSQGANEGSVVAMLKDKILQRVPNDHLICSDVICFCLFYTFVR